MGEGTFGREANAHTSLRACDTVVNFQPVIKVSGQWSVEEAYFAVHCPLSTVP